MIGAARRDATRSGARLDPRMAVALAFAATKLLLQLAALTPYGYFRDELYYLACARHLAFGYVDHPPLSIAVLAGWTALFGESIAAIRLVPAVAGAALVYVTGRLAAEIGGGVAAVALACLAVLCAPAFVSSDHAYSMNALDHLFWAVAALCFVRALEAGATASAPSIEDPAARAAAQGSVSRWVALGAVLGLGLLNKVSVLWLGAGFVLALALTERGRAALRTRGPWIAAAVAVLLFAPHVVWQIRNHFPTLEFARNAMAHKYVHLSLPRFLRESTLSLGEASVVLTAAGLLGPWVRGGPKGGRPLAIVFATALVVIAASKSGKPEYLDAAYSLVFASGGAALEAFASRTTRLARRVAATALVIALVAIGGVALPFALPVLSERAFIAYAKRLGVQPGTSERKEVGELPQHYADMHGWDELVEGTRTALDTLTPDERARARVLAVTGGYGPAAAVEVLGPKRGVFARAISGHNNYWLWGYGSDEDGPVVLLGGEPSRAETVFEHVERVTTIECGLCMPYENHKPVFVARGLKVPWAEIWPRVKHYE